MRPEPEVIDRRRQNRFTKSSGKSHPPFSTGTDTRDEKVKNDNTKKNQEQKIKVVKNVSTVSLPNYNELVKPAGKVSSDVENSDDKTGNQSGGSNPPHLNSSTISLPGEGSNSILTSLSEATIHRLEAYMRRCRSFGSLKPQQLLEKLEEFNKTHRAASESSDSWSGLDDWDLGIIEHCDPEAPSVPPLRPKSTIDKNRKPPAFFIGPEEEPDSELQASEKPEQVKQLEKLGNVKNLDGSEELKKIEESEEFRERKEAFEKIETLEAPQEVEGSEELGLLQRLELIEPENDKGEQLGTLEILQDLRNLKETEELKKEEISEVIGKPKDDDELEKVDGPLEMETREVLVQLLDLEKEKLDDPLIPDAASDEKEPEAFEIEREAEISGEPRPGEKSEESKQLKKLMETTVAEGSEELGKPEILDEGRRLDGPDELCRSDLEKIPSDWFMRPPDEERSIKKTSHYDEANCNEILPEAPPRRRHRGEEKRRRKTRSSSLTTPKILGLAKLRSTSIDIERANELLDEIARNSLRAKITPQELIIGLEKENLYQSLPEDAFDLFIARKKSSLRESLNEFLGFDPNKTPEATPEEDRLTPPPLPSSPPPSLELDTTLTSPNLVKHSNQSPDM